MDPGGSALAVVLHGHLPWAKGEPDAEAWFCEAVSGCYLPLLEVGQSLARDGVRAALALSLSPTLLAMLDDRELRAQARQALERGSSARSEVPAELAPALRFRAERAQRLLGLWDRVDGDLPTAFAALAKAGTLELLTCGMTHGYLPLLSTVPVVARAQVVLAGEAFTRRFGARPTGFWLPECGYTPGAEDWVAETGARWLVVDGPAFAQATPPPLAGVRSHLFLSNGVAAFARDAAACEQVWNAEVGFPGAPAYLDFHHRPHGPALHRVTGNETKQPWDPEAAFAQARTDARRFLDGVASGREGLVVAAFDAELFGHWWFEGPVFLDALFRLAAARGGVSLTTPLSWLTAHPEAELARLESSSWGRGGFHQTWLSEANQRLWPLLQRAGERMVQLANGGSERAPLLSRLATELLLAQASDWPFLLDANASTALAARRLEEHLATFFRCADAALAGNWVPLEALAETHNPLGQVDFRVYRSARG